MPETIELSQKTASGLGAVINDLVLGIRNNRIWRAFAYEELKNRYRRSALGMSWIVLSFLLLMSGLVLFFGNQGGDGNAPFIVYVSFGLVGFTFMMGSLTDACSVNIRSAGYIRSIRLPYSTYVFSSMARSLLPFFVQLATAIIVSMLFGWQPTLLALAVIPAIIIIIFNTVWIYLFLGIVGARFRDIQHFIGSLGRFLFFMTPVFWYVGDKHPMINLVANINPLTHYLEIFRMPLLGQSPSLLNVSFVAAMTIIGWVLALSVASKYQKRIPIWVS